MVPRIRFSIRTVLVGCALVAWVVCVVLPGGVYVALPLGVAAILFAAVVITFVGLVQSSKSRRNFVWASLRFGFALLVFSGLLAIYLPFWHLAVGLRNDRIARQAQHTYLFDHMPAERVRDDGRLLLSSMKASSTQSLSSSSDQLPESIARLEPVYVEARDDFLLVRLDTRPGTPQLLIYRAGAREQGHHQLAPGIWYFVGGPDRWITADAWAAGVRP